MGILYNTEFYYTLMVSMAAMALIVFAALQFIEAPYGMTFSNRWGPSINNRLGWIIMEAPAFFVMLAFCISSPQHSWPTYLFAVVYLLHYFQRSFIFPMLMRGKSRMALLIPAMGATFNIINAYFIGAWLFHFAPMDYYNFSARPAMLLATAIGILIFCIGLGINLQSDYIIRHLRKPGETGHKIPRGGMYNHVAAANYLGEIMEWVGYAIMTWSAAGALFALWTAANLVPRAGKLHQRYINEFGKEYTSLKRYKILPYIY